MSPHEFSASIVKLEAEYAFLRNPEPMSRHDLYIMGMVRMADLLGNLQLRGIHVTFSGAGHWTARDHKTNTGDYLLFAKGVARGTNMDSFLTWLVEVSPNE